MNNTTSEKQKIITPKKDERILVVKRTYLFSHDTWNGLQEENIDHYLSIIQEKKEFQWRSTMEDDPTYKQIIPYLIFQYQDSYFLMQRHSQASEKRLQSKFSFGIGGHIREEDLQGATIFDWAQREFHEEIHYTGALEIKPLGILNDDSNSVGKVHLGLVLLLKGNSNQISVKSELQSGILLPLETCKQYASKMENWSQIIFSLLDNAINK